MACSHSSVYWWINDNNLLPITLDCNWFASNDRTLSTVNNRSEPFHDTLGLNLLSVSDTWLKIIKNIGVCVCVSNHEKNPIFTIHSYYVLYWQMSCRWFVSSLYHFIWLALCVVLANKYSKLLQIGLTTRITTTM